MLSYLEVLAEPRHVVVLPGEGPSAAVWALPGAYWAVYAGSPIAFAERDGLPADAARLIEELGLPAYVLAPEALVSEAVLAQIAEHVPVQRIAGETPAEHAVLVTEYRDPRTEFGWGRVHERLDGYFHYALAAPSEAAQAYAALPLARSNAASFLFVGDDGGAPAETDRYLWSQRTDWLSTPSEGAFRHLWVVGDRLSYGAQGRLDLALEKADYPSKGPAGLGPLEALAIVFIAFGLAGMVFVLTHAFRLLPEVSPIMRLAWAGTALLFPVGGVILYLAAYRRPILNPDADMPKWLRPPAVQAAAATAMGFGFGAPLMVAIGYLFVWYGFPLFYGRWADGWEFLFGAGMPWMMAGMYVGAILIAWLLVQFPMRRMMIGASQARVLWTALGVTVLSMSAVGLGMMTVGWIMLMIRLPMMPAEDEILWFGALWLASLIGFLVAWPLNWPMVRLNAKPGTM